MRRPSPELCLATLEKAVLWHVIYTKPGCEQMIVDQLDAKAIETFLPLRRPQRRVRANWTPTPRPAFARYVFAAPPVGARPSELWNLRGEIGVLGADNPLLVPGKVMVELFERVDPQGFIEAPGFRPGDPVIVRSTPFAGLLGEISRVGGKQAHIWVAQLGATLRLPVEAIEAAGYAIRRERCA